MKLPDREAIDRLLVAETVYAIATSLDTRDWTLLDSVTTQDMEVDLSSFEDDAPVLSRADWFARLEQFFPHFDATQHIMSNPVVTVTGDDARCVAYTQALHLLRSASAGPVYTLGGFYTFDLRREARWKVRRLHLTVTWETGNRGIVTQVLERGQPV